VRKHGAGAKKPDPEPVLEVCRRLGIAPGACVLIGDSVHDVRAARLAGISFLAVSYGYEGGGEAEELRAARSVATLLEAAALLGEG